MPTGQTLTMRQSRPMRKRENQRARRNRPFHPASMPDNRAMRRSRVPEVVRAALAGLGLILDPLLGLVLLSTALARRQRPTPK